mmetsp:Transcript_25364/g.50544  ORF Transcript_25364/g.50544 Transcript_25364/m.50544 type:complete len:687 (+) Transcript_25364:85-2145(+)
MDKLTYEAELRRSFSGKYKKEWDQRKYQRQLKRWHIFISTANISDKAVMFREWHHRYEIGSRLVDLERILLCMEQSLSEPRMKPRECPFVLELTEEIYGGLAALLRDWKCDDTFFRDDDGNVCATDEECKGDALANKIHEVGSELEKIRFKFQEQMGGRTEPEADYVIVDQDPALRPNGFYQTDADGSRNESDDTLEIEMFFKEFPSPIATDDTTITDVSVDSGSFGNSGSDGSRELFLSKKKESTQETRKKRKESNNGENDGMHVIEEQIGNMASLLKNSTLAMNQTLKDQTKDLEEMETITTKNLEKIAVVTDKVKDHVQSQWSKIFGTWTLVAIGVGIFFGCYSLMKVFTKRRDACIFCNQNRQSTQHQSYDEYLNDFVDPFLNQEDVEYGDDDDYDNYYKGESTKNYGEESKANVKSRDNTEKEKYKKSVDDDDDDYLVENDDDDYMDDDDIFVDEDELYDDDYLDEDIFVDDDDFYDNDDPSDLASKDSMNEEDQAEEEYVKPEKDYALEDYSNEYKVMLTLDDQCDKCGDFLVASRMPFSFSDEEKILNKMDATFSAKAKREELQDSQNDPQETTERNADEMDINSDFVCSEKLGNCQDTQIHNGQVPLNDIHEVISEICISTTGEACKLNNYEGVESSIDHDVHDPDESDEYGYEYEYYGDEFGDESAGDGYEYEYEYY